MAFLEPWTEEPFDGFNRFRYMVRTGDHLGNGRNGFPWPQSGYFACEAWEHNIAANASEVIHYNVHDTLLSDIKPEVGLYGFLDCEWWIPEEGTIPYLWHGSNLGRSFQVLTVSMREVEQGWVLPEHRVPRCWVKYNGTLNEVLTALKREETEYSSMIADRLMQTIVTATKRNREDLALPVPKGSPTQGDNLVRTMKGRIAKARDVTGQFQPWEEEPYDGFVNYRYIVRTGDEDGRGEKGGLWPKSGYFACDKWVKNYVADRASVTHRRITDSKLANLDVKCGVFGFLDGDWWLKDEGTVPYLWWGSNLGRTFQVAVVDIREVELGTLVYEHRAPRCWVKYNGTLYEVLTALSEEGTIYSKSVADKLRNVVRLSIERNQEDRRLHPATPHPDTLDRPGSTLGTMIVDGLIAMVREAARRGQQPQASAASTEAGAR